MRIFEPDIFPQTQDFARRGATGPAGPAGAAGAPGPPGPPGTGATLFARIELTQAQAQALGSAPQTLVPAVAGSAVMPIALDFYGEITGAYLNTPTVQFDYVGIGGNSWTPNMVLPATTVAKFFLTTIKGTHAFNSASVTMPWGLALRVKYSGGGGGDLIGAGSFNGTVKVDVIYYLIPEIP